MLIEIKQFRVHWLDKTTSIVEGTDISNALTLAGYGGGASRAIDWWEELEEYE